jgi:hypothetical protein
MARRARLGNRLYMSTWQWYGQTLLLDRLNRRTKRTKQYYKRCPCRYVSDRQTYRQTDARNELNSKLTRTAHNKYLCTGLVIPQGPRLTSQCKLMQKQLQPYTADIPREETRSYESFRKCFSCKRNCIRLHWGYNRIVIYVIFCKRM